MTVEHVPQFGHFADGWIEASIADRSSVKRGGNDQCSFGTDTNPIVRGEKIGAPYIRVALKPRHHPFYSLKLGDRGIDRVFRKAGVAMSNLYLCNCAHHREASFYERRVPPQQGGG